jgi:hypothetical protein
MLALHEITWAEITDRLRSFIQQTSVSQPLPGGYEAETIAYMSGKDSIVLKVWNRDSRPDAAYQFHLLSELRNSGIRVPAALGLGSTGDGYRVLATTYEGRSVQNENVTIRILSELAMLLRSVHLIADRELEVQPPRFEFIAYFYPRIEEHPDLREPLIRLVGLAGMKQDCLIHGDYNMGNILEHAEGYVLIDWTNAQLGDARYDAAWASFLLRIYNGTAIGAAFREAYQASGEDVKVEWPVFESIACLRWLLLDRVAGLSPSPDTMARVNDFIRENPYLNETLLVRSTM